jgi:hypothetical protein
MAQIESKIRFEGEPPFPMPVIQSAQVDASENVVIMILYVIDPEYGPAPVPIHAQMISKVALALSAQLGRAGVEAELKDIGS